MLAPYLKEGSEEFLDSTAPFRNHWTDPILERVPDICSLNNDLYVGVMSNLYYVTGNLGIHAQDIIRKKHIKINTPPKSLILSTHMPTDPIKKSMVNLAIVLDKIYEDLFIVTTWICGTPDYRDIYQKEWCPSPGVGFISLNEPLNTSSTEKQEALKRIVGNKISDMVFQKKSLYGIYPFEKTTGNSLKDAEELDWVDSGCDLFLRFLLIMEMENEYVELKEIDLNDMVHKPYHVIPHKAKQLFINGKPFGNHIPDLPVKNTGKGTIEFDILSNLINLSDYLDI